MQPVDPETTRILKRERKEAKVAVKLLTRIAQYMHQFVYDQAMDAPNQQEVNINHNQHADLPGSNYLSNLAE